MRLGQKLLACMFMLVLCLNDANAGTYPCPAGCFCLDAGKYETEVKNHSESIADGSCKTSAKTVRQKYSISAGNCQIYILDKKQELNDSLQGRNNNYPEEYVFVRNEFSELYYGNFGVYGIKDGEFISSCGLGGFKNVFQCPDVYPNSDEGSKGLADCYKYDVSGNKIHYGENKLKVTDYNGWVPIVTCQPGFYMPANTTECRRCNGNNYACPGGMFYTDTTYNSDRGRILCQNGVNASGTSCKSTDGATTNTTGNNQVNNINNAGTKNTNADNTGLNTNNMVTETVTETKNKTNNTVTETVTETKNKTNVTSTTKSEPTNTTVITPTTQSTMVQDSDTPSTKTSNKKEIKFKFFDVNDEKAAVLQTDRAGYHNPTQKRGADQNAELKTMKHRSGVTVPEKSVRDNPRNGSVTTR